MRIFGRKRESAVRGGEQLPSKQSVGRAGTFRLAAVPRLPAVLLSAALAASLCLPGCASAPRSPNVPATVADLRDFPQSLEVLAELYGEAGQGAWSVGPLRGAETVLRGHAEAREDMAYFRQRFFQPWDETGVDREIVQYLLDELERAPGERGFAENMHPWSEREWQKMADNADLPRLRRVLRGGRPMAAVTVRAADLRAAPTMSPRFSKVFGAGGGWPFDLFQQSRLHAGTPLAVYHKTLDGAWLLVQSPSVWGWIRAEEVAGAGKEFRRLWRKTPLAAFVREGVGLKFKALGAGADNTPQIRPGSYLASADIGAVLPSPRDGEVLLPLRGLDGSAYVVTAFFADYEAPSRISPERYDVLSRPVVRMPLLLTPGNVARVGDRMMGQPYGWGGLYGRRDCSATMQDLFAPFGLWLPRNSKDQGEEGRPQSLEGLSASAKERALREKARPFRTLLWMPGHIGLYGRRDCSATMQDLFAPFGLWLPRNSKDQGEEGRPQSLEGLSAEAKERALREKARPFRTLIAMPGHIGLYAGQWEGKAAMFHTMWGVRNSAGGEEGRLVIGRSVVTGLRPGKERGDVDEECLLIERVKAFTVLGLE